MGYDKLGLLIGQDQIPNDPTQNVRPTKTDDVVLNRDRKLPYPKIHCKHFVFWHLYPDTACTRPVITLSMQRCGTSSRSFRQTLCHTMSVRVHADS